MTAIEYAQKIMEIGKGIIDWDTREAGCRIALIQIGLINQKPSSSVSGWREWKELRSNMVDKIEKLEKVLGANRGN
jgi:hypothetical protein